MKKKVRIEEILKKLKSFKITHMKPNRKILSSNLPGLIKILASNNKPFKSNLLNYYIKTDSRFNIEDNNYNFDIRYFINILNNSVFTDKNKNIIKHKKLSSYDSLLIESNEFNNFSIMITVIKKYKNFIKKETENSYLLAKHANQPYEKDIQVIITYINNQ